MTSLQNNSLSSCQLCPFRCKVNRLLGQKGVCQVGLKPRVALASLHPWEEPCLSGVRGSGTVFFSGCNLSCLYCQNQTISAGYQGTDVSIERLAEIFLEQQQRGAHNLNLVSPTPYVPQIIEALALARGTGFELPVIYNSSAYDSPETIDSLSGWVDVYLPDLKYYSDNLAVTLSRAPGYFSHAMAAIRRMIAQVGPCQFDRDGLLRRGVLIRHLALPGQTEDSRRVLSAMSLQLGPETWFSLMNQYTPPKERSMPLELGRRITDREYDDLIDFALSLGMENGFIQGEGTASDKFIPDFNLDGVGKKGSVL